MGGDTRSRMGGGVPREMDGLEGLVVLGECFMKIVFNANFLLLFPFCRSMRVNEMKMKKGMVTVKQRCRTATHTRDSTSTVGDTVMVRTASKTVPDT